MYISSLHLTTFGNAKRVAEVETDGAHDFKKRARTTSGISPRESDISFFGNNDMTCAHPGNAVFTNIIKQCIQQFRPAPDNTLCRVAQDIVEGFASLIPPIRFLYRSNEAGGWFSLSKSDAILVTGRALNEEQQHQQEMSETTIVSKCAQKSIGRWQCMGLCCKNGDATTWQTDFCALYAIDLLDKSSSSAAALAIDNREGNAYCRQRQTQQATFCRKVEATSCERMNALDTFEKLLLSSPLDKPLPLNSTSSSSQVEPAQPRVGEDALESLSDYSTAINEPTLINSLTEPLKTWSSADFNNVLAALENSDDAIEI